MKKGSLFFKIFLLLIFLWGVPSFLLYYFDNIRIVQLNNLQSKILWAENQKEISVIKDQVEEKINENFSLLKQLFPEKIKQNYSAILNDRIIRNFSYSKKSSKRKIIKQFLKYSKRYTDGIALLFRNGRVLVTNEPELKRYKFSRNTKFLQSLPSKKITYNINFSTGIAEYFIPVIDTKNRVVSILYVKKDIINLVDKIRRNVLSKRGYNFIIDMTGKVILHTNKIKENSENILMNRDLKNIVSTSNEKEIREVTYSNLKGILGYKKIKNLDFIICSFTPYADYSFMKKPRKKYESILFNTDFIVPLYYILIGTFLLGLLLIFPISSSPFKPLKKIVRALTHIDEEGFEELLPKVKKGDYKKIIDSLIILKGRIKSAEEKTEKLSQMAKNLEEELSKEASRYESEITELRDALKISENTKLSLEEENSKLKNEIEKVKKDAEQKLKMEKNILQQKIKTLEEEVKKLKEEVKKAQESKVPVEKENMRTEAVLMMNTELKGVLSVIKTYISSVLGGEGKITDAQQQFLGVVINKSARLERLINDLTELAKIEKGEVKFNKQIADVNTIIQDIIFAIQPQADIKKVDIKVNFSPTLPNINTDASRLSNIITQILNQAIKVSPRGGQITIETKEEANNILIKIHDFGMSMPQSKAKALFTNFHGTDSPAGPEFINTGLRFPIIKALINALGGDIWVESEIGKGKTFVISLPKGKDESHSTVKKPAIEKEKIERLKEEAKKDILVDIDKKEKGTPVDKKIIHTKIPFSEDIQQIDTEKKDEKEPEIKIQRNEVTDLKKEPETVSELLSFEKPKEEEVNIPGKDVKVPEDLIENEKVENTEKEDKENKEDIKNIEEKKIGLPDELPPLPDLEDDKGSDIIT